MKKMKFWKTNKNNKKSKKTPELEESPSIVLKLTDERFFNWILSVKIEDVADENLRFSYIINHVPKDITDEEIDDLKEQLEDFLSEKIYDILQATSEKTESLEPLKNEE